MIESSTKIRVRYAETDQMGYVYYGNYAQYYEVARVDALRMLGVSYKLLENTGVIMPVIEMKINFKKPAYYDDELLIKTFINKLPEYRMVFKYEIYNSSMILINTAETTLVFIDKISLKPCLSPIWFSDQLKKYFVD
jgi:acyl-CoA thioester hydrolase